jgi:hypothetical protein
LDNIRSDESKFLRQNILKEQDMKKYGKLGVSRTRPHGISNYADCEYASLSDVVDGVDRCPGKLSKSEVVKFLEQAGDRLVGDADLLSLADMVTILNAHHRCDYVNLRLFAKLRNEIIYDVAKIYSVLDIAIIMNCFSHFNIVSPRLLSALIARGTMLLGSEAATASDLCLVIQSLKSSYPQHKPTMDFVHACLNSLPTVLEADIPNIAMTLRVLIDREESTELHAFIKPIVLQILAFPVTDIETASNVLYVVSKADSGANVAPVIELVNASTRALLDAFTPTSGKSIEYIESRNRASKILGYLVLSRKCSELDSLITRESVRGMTGHQLKGLAKEYDACKLELIRRGLMLADDLSR